MWFSALPAIIYLFMFYLKAMSVAQTQTVAWEYDSK